MLFFRFSTTKRQCGLSNNQASQDQALLTLVLEVGSEAVDGESLPCVDTTHGVARPGVFLLVVLLGASGAGLQPERTGPAGHAGGF